MKIGYIGYGFVGKAQHSIFEHNSEAYIVDPAKNANTISELVWSFNPPIIFVSVGAPTLEDGSLDYSAISAVLQELTDHNYAGIVVLKSTLTPAALDDLYNKFANEPILNKFGPLHFVYSPEFLREGHWRADALKPAMIILAGNWHYCQIIKDCYEKHSHIRGYLKFYLCDVKTASLVKYTINAFLATKVTFMNQMYQLYKDTHGGHVSEEDWKEFTTILSSDVRMGTSHLSVPGPDGNFGYGGSCFPKDVKAIIAADTSGRLTVLREVELANTKIRIQGNGTSGFGGD